MSISSLSSLLNQPSYASTASATSSSTQFQQQLAVNSTDPTADIASTGSTITTTPPAVKGGGGHHHHKSSFGSGEVDNQSTLDNVSQLFGADAADDVSDDSGNVDLSKLSSLMGSSSSSQASALAANPLLDLTA